MTTTTFTITVTDAAGKTATTTVTCTEDDVAKPLTVSGTVNPLSGPPGTVFNIGATAAGGKGPYTYAISPAGPTPVAGNPGQWTWSSTPVTPPGGGGSLPTGVTLAPIDGEVMIDATTMSNNYFARNGFNYAASMGWDSPAFFSMGAFYGGYFGTQADMDRYKGAKLNCSWRLTAGTSNANNLSLVQSNNLGWSEGAEGGNLENGSTLANAPPLVSLLCDEPSTMANVSDPITKVPNAMQDGRFYYINFTYHQICGSKDVGGTPMVQVLSNLYASPGGAKRHVDLTSADIYWFAAANTTFWRNAGGQFYQQPSGLTADQMARGSHYGDMIDVFRGYQTGKYPAPILTLPEVTDGKITDAGKASITPAQMHWAIWGAIIHGARGVLYFTSANEFTDSLGTYSVPVNQATATNTLILQLAPVINSPFALGYASVTPARYVFPTANLSLADGIDICAHWYQGKFYIFACTSFSQTATNIAASYTIKNTGATKATILDGRGGSINLTNGTTFSDPFAKASDVHIYRID